MLRCSAIGCQNPATSQVIWIPPKTGDNEVIHLCPSCCEGLKRALSALGLDIISEAPIQEAAHDDRK